jgi:probable HAF family extracellular repeat protein
MPVYTFSTFDDPSASTGATNAFGINDTGQIVGSYRDPMNVFHGFLLSGGTYTPLTDPLATNSTTAVGINAAGQIVGRYHNGTGTHGFLYNGGIYSTLDVPSATLTAASGINSSGVVVGTYRNASGAHGFIYDPSNMANPFTTLDAPLAFGDTEATGVNDAGQVVGLYIDVDNAIHGFLYNPNGGGYTILDDPLNTDASAGTEPGGINNAGQIVGNYTDASGTHGFLYSGGFFITIDDPVANSQTVANGINNKNQIVGTLFNNALSQNHGFLETPMADPPPPPGTTADMILRGANSSPGVAGQYEIYDIGSNSLLAAYQLGTVGTDWQFVGLGGFFGSDTTDLVLRNVNTGAFEVYDIANNQITAAAPLGQVGLDWQLGGFAANAPTASSAAMGGSSQVGQLVQAMANFGGGSGAAESMNIAALGADSSQQPLLTPPQHA